MNSNGYLSTTILALVVALSGCNSSGSTDESADVGGEGTSGLEPIVDLPGISGVQDLVGDIPDGNITTYGSITVGDDAGVASDLVAAFFEVEEGVSAEFLSMVFDGTQTLCTVDADDNVDFEEISVGFIPSFNGVSKLAISAGESIELSSDVGSFASIQGRSSGSFLFYTVPDMQMLPSGPVPQMLQVNIAGDVYPAYGAALMPDVTTLTDVNYGSSSTISSQTSFSWTPSSEAGSLIRIFSSTAGGFFVEDGMTVTCLTPDTGNFEFPLSVRNKLGASFIGGTPIISRVAVRTETTDNSILFLIRESFAD